MPDYTSTKMRVAGNIAAGLVQHPIWAQELAEYPIRQSAPAIAGYAVAIANAIVTQVQLEAMQGSVAEVNALKERTTAGKE